MSLQLFNLETMSGVFPGVRTQLFQRLFLQLLPDRPTETDTTPHAGIWAQLFWYREPRACVLYMPTADPDDLASKMAGDTDASAGMVPVFRLAEPQRAHLLPALQETLAANGWQMVACGSCAHWHANDYTSDDTHDAAAGSLPENLPLGRCGWRAGGERAVDAALCEQSALALGCPHWHDARALAADARPGESTALPAPPESGDADAADAPPAQAGQSFWGRVIAFLTQRVPGGESASGASPVPLAQRIVERSGVGAGTQPCFACQGRIANLGALVVETEEGDQQTLSVWRCRACYTYYLNNWIDRWVRLDSLETQESFYRLAPAEAVQLLQRMEAISGGDHPARRAERSEQRTWFEAFMAQREPVSHQVKLGR